MFPIAQFIYLLLFCVVCKRNVVFAVRKTVEDLRKHTIFRARFALYGRAISMWFFFRFISHPISWNNKISAIILLENNYFASSFVFLSRISFVFCVCVHVHYIICSIYLWILIVKLKIPIQKLENIQCFFFLVYSPNWNSVGFNDTKYPWKETEWQNNIDFSGNTEF